MPRFLFWNLNNRPIPQLVKKAARGNDVDVLVLAECDLSIGSLLTELNAETPDFQFAPGQCERIRVFTRFRAAFLAPLFESDHISIRRLRLPLRDEILIVMAHLPSKMHSSPGSQRTECSLLARNVLEQEATVGHKRTIVIGDFNTNPYEHGFVATDGLHAVMSKSVALRGTRRVSGRDFDFFYNPMWSCFGDIGDRPSGTYYYDKAEHVNYFWHMFDQVLLRPTLLGGFSDSVRILTEAGETHLLDGSGRPDTKNASDHLPIVFSLDF
ncbi:MAG TPA: endonuclease/exonuclease/phosphatase family protein [Candidatus Binatia bacterium]|nr:endonuclease/exonuclease/phosphatase family protein [Candidatus Binatia bacterium]